jgi:hypothetical protein
MGTGSTMRIQIPMALKIMNTPHVVVFTLEKAGHDLNSVVAEHGHGLNHHDCGSSLSAHCSTGSAPRSAAAFPECGHDCVCGSNFRENICHDLGGSSVPAAQNAQTLEHLQVPRTYDSFVMLYMCEKAGADHNGLT